MGMKGLDKVLVDTSAWIDFFRKNEPLYSKVLHLIDEDRVCCIGIVLAELIQGTKSAEEIKTLKDFISVFTFLEESVELWEKAGELSFSLKKAGKRGPLSDCYIAAAAHKGSVPILTLDKHFCTINEKIDLKLM
jgi:predicted nucleic acid-binding protein